MMKINGLRRRPLLMAFLLPMVIMLITVEYKKIFPFGDRSFLRVDLYNQYFPFFTEFYRKLHEGGSLAYSWRMGLGGSFAGVYAYYLASPLHFVLLFCPEGYIQECMVLLIILKIGLCGFFFGLWLKEHFYTDSYLIASFALLYALSGFTAAYNWNIMWLDVVYLAPLVILGLEKMLRGEQVWLYPISLGAAILCNYYLCIMLCIFLVLLFFMYCIPMTWKERGQAAIRFTIGSLLGGMISGIVSLPGVFALRATKFDNPSFPKEIKSYFNLLDAMSRHFVNTAAEIRTDHWPNVYCGVIVLLLVPLWFGIKKIPLKEKIAAFLLIAFFWASYTFNILTFFWHGLNFPDSLPARQSYLYIFFVLTLAYDVLRELRKIEKDEKVTRVIVACIAISAAFVLACALFGHCDDLTFVSYAMTALYFAAYVIVIFGYMYGSVGHRLFVALMLIALFSETLMNTVRVSVPTTDRMKYVNAYETNRHLVGYAHDFADGDFYRIEEWERKTKNDGILADYPSATYFSSTANGGVENLYRKLGMASSKVFYHAEGMVPLTAAMLGIRFCIGNDHNPGNAFYKPIYSTDERDDIPGNRTLYEAEDVLPLGYVVPSDLQERWEEEIAINKEKGSSTPVANLNALVRALGIQDKLFSLRKDDEGGYLYAYVLSSPTKNVKFTAGDKEKTFEKINYKHILSLGEYQDGADLSIEQTGTVTNEKMPLDVKYYRMHEAVSHAAVEKLAESPFVIELMNDLRVEGYVQAEKEGNLLFSIPYEEGWKAYVDGVETEIQPFEDAFIQVPVKEGRHDVKLVFSPPGVLAGKMSTVFGLLWLVLWIRFEKKRLKKAPGLLQ